MHQDPVAALAGGGFDGILVPLGDRVLHDGRHLTRLMSARVLGTRWNNVSLVAFNDVDDIHRATLNNIKPVRIPLARPDKNDRYAGRFLLLDILHAACIRHIFTTCASRSTPG